MGCGRRKYKFDIQGAGLCKAGWTMVRDTETRKTKRGVDFRGAGRLEREWEA